MTRRAFLALLTVAAFAQAAPAPRHWVAGWDKPSDPRGGTRFDREGDRLTLRLPGLARLLTAARKDAPRLLRDAEGDFQVQVRVSGKVGPTPGADQGGPFQAAGLVVMASETTVYLERTAWSRPEKAASAISLVVCSPRLNLQRDKGEAAPPRQEPVYLRLVRQGDKLEAALSEDGVSWTCWEPVDVPLPRRVKVGVAAENASGTPFAPRFDQFSLKRPETVPRSGPVGRSRGQGPGGPGPE